jgi:hypothetical protein
LGGSVPRGVALPGTDGVEGGGPTPELASRLSEASEGGGDVSGVPTSGSSRESLVLTRGDMALAALLDTIPFGGVGGGAVGGAVFAGEGWSAHGQSSRCVISVPLGAPTGEAVKEATRSWQSGQVTQSDASSA